ncbi:MAG: radical SAM protein [Bacillota bacterium]|nr:radical SAM protein [Bacillota bacterium]
MLVTLRKKTYLSYPFDLSIYPTFQCQANCKFCFIAHGVKKESVQLNITDWKRIIDESASQGVTSVAILGGEPTLYKHITELIKCIEEVQIGTTLTTNGQLLTPEVEDALLSSRYVNPCFSVQAISKKNNELMGIPYDQALENLKRLRARGKQCGINSVLTTQTFADIKRIIDFCLHHGVSVYSGSICFPKNDFETVYSIRDARILDEKVQEYLYKRNATGFTFAIEGCMYFSAFHDSVTEDPIDNEFEKVSFGCECGNRKLELACNGYAYACCVYMDTDQKDDLRKYKTVRDLWDNSKNLSFFRNLKATTPEECGGCNFSSFCKGGCPYLISKSGKVLGAQKETRCEITI